VESDLSKLWKLRGLTEPTCRAMGYRSNQKSNKELLLALEKEFPPAMLLDSGLWSQRDKPADQPKPNPQFCGMALVQRRGADRKKDRDCDGETITDCVWDEGGFVRTGEVLETIDRPKLNLRASNHNLKSQMNEAENLCC
jgi:hypothetical protein